MELEGINTSKFNFYIWSIGPTNQSHKATYYSYANLGNLYKSLLVKYLKLGRGAMFKES